MMLEADSIQKQVSLSDRDVWIIDDDIPIGLLKPGDESMTSGDRPIDRGTLRSLLGLGSWRDRHLQELCRELVDEARCVTAFPYPGPAILHLRRGAPIPDVVIFDWEYLGLSQEDVQDSLECILKQCLSIVQVYTNLNTQEIARTLNTSFSKHGARLEQPRSKAGTRTQELMEALESKLECSLSARLASETRRLSLAAIEEVLVRIDDLSLNKALDMLASKKSVPTESELVELLSVKVSEALESSRDIARAVEDWAKEKEEIPEEAVPQCVREVVGVLSANVRRHVQRDGGLMREIELVRSPSALKDEETKESDETIQEFFAFRLYHRPGDDLVRTGDIILWQQTSNVDDPPGELHLVVTPPCDLERFWKKTRGCLTLARMYSLASEVGAKRMKLHGNRSFKLSGSITAAHPMVMPSVILTEDKCADYVLFAHEIWSANLQKKEDQPNESPLTYADLSDLGLRVKRLCTTSEPFLAGVLEKLSATLFATGVPDYPEDEKKRLRSSYKCIDHR